MVRAVSVLVVTFFLFQCGSTPMTPPVRSPSLYRTVQIPGHNLTTSSVIKTAMMDSGALALSPGAPEELPEGPNSFDVFKNGWLVINDPLTHRIVIYDSLGKYQFALQVPFSVSSLWLTDAEDLYIEKATTGEIFDINRQSQIQPVSHNIKSAADQSRGKFIDFNHGEIQLPHRRDRGVPAIKVDFHSDSSKMVALYPLTLDESGNMYIVIESFKPAETLAIAQIIRKYTPNGALDAQIDGVPMDYFIIPRDKFRVRNGRVYQLLPQREKVLLHIWNTN